MRLTWSLLFTLFFLMASSLRLPAQSPSGTSGPAVGPNGPEGALLRVFDSNNKFVGNVVGTGANGTVAHVPYRLNGILFTLGVSRTAVGGNGGGPLYETSNCTGTPYMQSDGSIIFAASGVGGNTLYVEDVRAPAQTITFSSSLFGTVCIPHIPLAIAVRPALQFVDFVGQFAPPFSVR